MSKKAVLGTLAAAIALAYGGGTWLAGSKVKSSYEAALDEVPKQTALVRVVERSYERGFFGAVSTVTLELGCAADAALQVPAVKPAAEKDQEEEEETATPFKAVRITFRDTIRHGPFAGGTLAAATIDSELVFDVKGQAKAEQIFGKAKPLTAHTKMAFDGAYTTDLAVAPAGLAEEGKARFAWQGAQLRIETNGARTHVRYDLTMPGLDVGDARTGATLKMGKLTSKADMDKSAGWILATGKTEARLDSLEFAAPKGLGGAAGGEGKAVPAVLLQDIDIVAEATIADGLYASTGTFKGTGKIGDTKIDKFEMSSGGRRIHAAGYKKLADAWMQSSAANGCGKGGGKASQAAMKVLFDQLAPDLKAMAKYSPEIGLDRMLVEIGGKRGEISYTAGMAGVTDEDLQAPGMALLMKRGVLKASARLPMQWLEQIAATGAESGQTPPPEMMAGLVAQGEEKGFVKREGDDVTAQIEYAEGSLKLNGKPLGAPGQ
ncbi:YdgA family protein [Variovorax paradoxus]|uniref:YdgA family protein n=1 Tax=Variovorax paradoxus TaxID=34073 RepID=UPI0027D782D5|nr:YdgA family protein [Variovorax paradoxus]